MQASNWFIISHTLLTRFTPGIRNTVAFLPADSHILNLDPTENDYFRGLSGKLMNIALDNRIMKKF